MLQRFLQRHANSQVRHAFNVAPAKARWGAVGALSPDFAAANRCHQYRVGATRKSRALALPLFGGNSAL